MTRLQFLSRRSILPVALLWLVACTCFRRWRGRRRPGRSSRWNAETTRLNSQCRPFYEGRDNDRTNVWRQKRYRRRHDSRCRMRQRVRLVARPAIIPRNRLGMHVGRTHDKPNDRSRRQTTTTDCFVFVSHWRLHRSTIGGSPNTRNSDGSLPTEYIPCGAKFGFAARIYRLSGGGDGEPSDPAVAPASIG